MNEAIGPLVFFWVTENRFRIKITNLPGDAAIEAGGVEARDIDDAAVTLEQVFPHDLQLVAQRRGNAHSGDDDSAIHEKVISDE